ncbi:HNH endonuclease [Endozoicomonas sp. Mp262]|uniref:HNH endonuclease n=1 Tax=Endozoicomonas sp. Mp262 TaxID=2919499 RepID=UPI0021DB34E9
MPARTKKACRKRGCSGTTRERHGYCERHGDLAHSYARKQRREGSASQRGYGAAWQKLRRAVLERDGYLCQECRRQGIAKTANHVDHIKAKAFGGDDSLDNLQALCPTCHHRKSGREGAALSRR